VRNEDHGQDGGHWEERIDGRIRPGLGVAALLECEEQTCGRAQTEDDADEVEAEKLPPTFLRKIDIERRRLSLEDEADASQGNSADGQIDWKKLLVSHGDTFLSTHSL
jgi:hypothetical protein